MGGPGTGGKALTHMGTGKTSWGHFPVVRQKVSNFHEVQSFKEKQSFADALSLVCSLENAASWEGMVCLEDGRGMGRAI